MQTLERFAAIAATRGGTIVITVGLIAGLAYMGKLTRMLISLSDLLDHVSAGLMRLSAYTAVLGW